MKVEIEIKMRLRDRVAVESRLRAAAAQEQATVVESNTYFDTPEGALKSSDRGLRLRRVVRPDAAPEALLTYKGPRAHGKLKSRTECELTVGDARAAAEVLAGVGYLPTLSFEKRRTTWGLDGCQIALDTLPYLGEFVEIEGPSDDAVLAVRNKLGLTDVSILHPSYIAMLATYLHENQLTERVVKLEK